MTQGRLESSSQQSGRSKGQLPRTALIIGGGLAGCTAAHALAQRGIQVTLLESASQLASAASGNPRGILHARFAAGLNTLHRFVLAAYGHALALLDEVMPVDGVQRAECGLLQLAATQSEAKRIGKLAAQEWPPHLLQAVDAELASQLSGLPMTHGGLWFPAGGWVVPPEVCARLALHPNITVRLDSEVTSLERTASGWRASGEGFAIEAEQAVVCSAHQAKKLAQFAEFPLLPVRGQISVLAATEASKKMQAVLCAEGYCAPAVEGQHVTGATSSFDDDGTDIREPDHAENLAKLAAHMPALQQALGDAPPLDGRAAVRCSMPGSTPLVGEVEQGLYCSLAHGTRGLLTAGIASEIIASQMCGQLPPLPHELLDALSPLHRTRNTGK
jgi:tRNA 5-methylaminomethyl-2-thiouridine biosynthesis bifunctional protein